jgi:hypothetical protein
MSATQLEQDTTHDPGADAGREPPQWPHWAHVIADSPALSVAAMVLAAAMIVAVAILIGAATDALTGPGHAKVDTFTDPLGRDCTQLTKGHALALSCAPKPLEDRIADGLRGQA